MVPGLAGAGAGLTTLALDQLAVLLLLGYPVMLSPRQVAVYPLAGSLLGLVAAIGRAIWLRRRATGAGHHLVDRWASTLALLALLTAAGRLQYLLSSHLHVAASYGLGLVGAAVAGGGWWLLLRALLARFDLPERAPHRWSGVLTALTITAGLAVNRHTFDAPLALGALASDFGILGAILGLAYFVGRWGTTRLVTGTVAALVLIFLGRSLISGRSASGNPAAAPEAPHVVLLIVDTLRYDVYHSVARETPEGRRFQSALGPAVSFDQAIASAPWTVPSTASILTGLHPQEHGHGVRDRATGRFTRLASSIPTLAEVFTDAGYRTEALVTNPWLAAGSGVDRGFAHYEELECAEGMLPLLILTRRLGIIPYGIYQPAQAVRRRLAGRLRSPAPSSRPLFLWLHLMDPHNPLHAHSDLNPEPEDASLAPRESLYRQEVRHTLREVTAMIELLGDRGLWPNTLFVLVSDHGEMFESDGHGRDPSQGRPLAAEGHGHALYDELVRVPLVVRPPKSWNPSQAGRLSRSAYRTGLASHVDVAATILDLAGVEGHSIPGRSLLSMEPPRLALSSRGQNSGRQESLRTTTWKLIHHPARAVDELYDLESDPGEQVDLSLAESERRKRLRRLLKRRLREMAEPPAGEFTDLDDEDRARLRALGYIE